MEEIEFIVLSMWGESEELITQAVKDKFNLGYNEAYELVLQAIAEEVKRDESYDEPTEYDEWESYDPYC